MNQTDQASLFELRRVSKFFANPSSPPALAAVDLRIERGTTCVLLGPSGCGKTTLLRLLAGLERPSQGQVLYTGQPIPQRPVALRHYRQQLGYVIQEGGLFPHLNAWDNLALAAHQQAWHAERIALRIQSLRELMQLPAHLLKRYPAQMSGGQRQRLALMRALMLEPEVLLLDEPLGALDPMIRYELQHELKQTFQALAKTVVLVTHDLAEAAWFSDDLVLMKQGQVIQRGSVKQLRNQASDTFVERFVQAQRGLGLAALSE